MPRGTLEVIEIDGQTFAFGAENLSIVPDRNESAVKTKGDTKLYRDYNLAGLPNVEESFAITLPIGGMVTDAEIRAAERLRLLGGFHTASVWKYERQYYTAVAGQTDFYIASRRRDAASVKGISGLYPPLVWLNGSAVATVSVVSGYAPATPGAGACNVGDTPVPSGSYRDYTKFCLAACNAGDIIEFAVMPLFRVYVASPRIDFPSGNQERHDLVLLER